MAGPKGLIIAIDGPAGSGKSTTAKLLARRLGYLYLDTGAMYRALTLKVIRAGIDAADQSAVVRLAEKTAIHFNSINGDMRVFLDGEDVSDEIRKLEVTALASSVSEVPRVREVLVGIQREIGRAGGVVLEGRDIGTVVFPDADLKVYLQADLHIRAIRRQRELTSGGFEVTLEDVKEELVRRDMHDSSRAHSPLQRASDAVITDTTNLMIEEQVDVIEKLVREKLNKP